MTRASICCVALVLTIAATACTTRSASIDHRMIQPGGSERLEMQRNELFVMPVALLSPPPDFPESLQRKDMTPTRICAELWLSDEGAVTHVASLYGTEGCSAGQDASTQALEDAVMARLRDWDFTPARICSFSETQRDKFARGDCTGDGVVITSIPIRLAYVFTFEVKNGKRHVMASSAAHKP